MNTQVPGGHATEIEAWPSSKVGILPRLMDRSLSTGDVSDEGAGTGLSRGARAGRRGRLRVRPRRRRSTPTPSSGSARSSRPTRSGRARGRARRKAWRVTVTRFGRWTASRWTSPTAPTTPHSRRTRSARSPDAAGRAGAGRVLRPGGVLEAFSSGAGSACGPGVACRGGSAGSIRCSGPSPVAVTSPATSPRWCRRRASRSPTSSSATSRDRSSAAPGPTGTPDGRPAPDRYSSVKRTGTPSVPWPSRSMLDARRTARTWLSVDGRRRSRLGSPPRSWCLRCAAGRRSRASGGRSSPPPDPARWGRDSAGRCTGRSAAATSIVVGRTPAPPQGADRRDAQHQRPHSEEDGATP